VRGVPESFHGLRRSRTQPARRARRESCSWANGRPSRPLRLEWLEDRRLLSLADPMGGGAVLPDDAVKDWTFMVYLAADNNLEEAAIVDFLEMASVGSGTDINIVVQFDRVPGYYSGYGDWTDCRRGLIAKNNTPSASWGTSIGEVNMGDPAVLSGFVNWAISTYPAEKYALVLWDHGGGWRYASETDPELAKGSCGDDTSGDDLENREVRWALADVAQNIDVFAYDACIMGMIECAHEIKDEATIFVASEQFVPWSGYPYDDILANLKAHPTWTAAEFGADIVNEYGDCYEDDGYDGDTLSAIDLAIVGAASPGGLSAALDGLAAAIMSDASQTDYNDSLTAARTSAAYLNESDTEVLRDLGRFLTSLAGDVDVTASIHDQAAAALAVYNNAVIANFTDPTPNGTGLSTYLQAPGDAPDGDYRESIILFADDTQWDEFLEWWESPSWPSLETIYSNNLIANPGWTISGGQWAFGVPAGGGGTEHGYPDPTSGATGANVYGVNLSGDYSTTVTGPWYLTTGPIDCSDYANVTLKFQRWLNTDYPHWAYATVDVSNDGVNWTNISTNPYVEIVDSAWRPAQYDISSVADRQSTVWIRWGYETGQDVWPYSGWNIDDVLVAGIEVAGPRVTGQSPADLVGPGQTSMEFTFDEPMNTTSFSVSADVASFTGPGGVNLKSQISGYTWLSNQKLKVTFASQTAMGTYTMVVGPNITDASPSANPMNQDGDVTNGEIPADRYTGTFTIGAAAPGVLIGVDFGPTGDTSPANWTQWIGGAGTTLVDLVGENGAATPLDLTIAGSSSFGTSTGTPLASTVPIHWQSLSGLDGYLYKSGSPTWTFTWSDLVPGENYEVYVFGLRSYSTVNNVTIAGGGTPISFAQNLSAGKLFVNGEQGNSGRALADFAEYVTADAAGQIVITVSGSSYAALAGLGIRAQNLDLGDAPDGATASALTTTMAAGYSQSGNMFDVTALDTVTITSVDAHPLANTDYAIYYKTGSHVGFENNAAAWTLLGTALGVVAQPQGTPTPIPIAIDVTIPAGETCAFYVTSTTTATQWYTKGSAVGNVFVSDAYIQVREGTGNAYPFGTVYSPRVFNGIVHYSATFSHPTLLASDGARHLATGPTLGFNRDVEDNGQPTLAATGDDSVGTPDDEDGVTFVASTLWASTRAANAAARVEVNLRNADAARNQLDAWIDFNRDGDWDDPGEKIFDDYSLGTGNGVRTLVFTIPRDTGGNVVLGGMFARFRLSTAGGLAPTGAANDGEVEDYAISLLAADPVPGDANLDGVVNDADAAILANHWGLLGAAWADGDFTDDGRVNAADAAILTANWGATFAPPGGEGASVSSAAAAPSVLVGPIQASRADTVRQLIRAISREATLANNWVTSDSVDPAAANVAGGKVDCLEGIRDNEVEGPLDAMYDAVLSEQYGQQVETLGPQRSACLCTMARRELRRHDRDVLDATALAIDLILLDRSR